MAEGDFCELAEERVNGTIVDPGTKVVHVPWWIHGSYYRTKCPFNASLVVCDHAFGEMSNFGLKYIRSLHLKIFLLEVVPGLY